MDYKSREKSYSEYLDTEKKNKLFIRFVFSEDYISVESFAVIYCTLIGEDFQEVARFDSSRFENVNVHRFYSAKKHKIYLDKHMDWSTIEEVADDLRKNWQIYLVKFLDK